METAITNPEGALGSPAKLGQSVHRFIAGGIVGVNRLVTIDDDGVKIAGAAAPIIGVSVTAAAAAGDVIDVVTHGEATLVAGDTVAAGATVIAAGSAGAGKTGTAATSLTAGVALDDAADTETFRVWVQPS